MRGGRSSGHGDHALQYSPQVCSIARADGYLEFPLHTPPVRRCGLEAGLASCG